MKHEKTDENQEESDIELTGGAKGFSLKARGDVAVGLKIAVSIAIVLLSVGVVVAGVVVAYVVAVKQ